MSKQPVEAHPDLARHIARMASTGNVGSLIEWQEFTEAMNAALRASAAVGREPAAVKAVIKSLREMVEMMDSGDEHGAGSPWHVDAAAALSAIDGGNPAPSPRSESEIIEQCAKVAESCATSRQQSARATAFECGDAIRALATSQTS